jgi:hypothetical protein
VNVQFDWWLLIVGFVIGAGLTGLVLAELRRREDDLTARERQAEAAWIAADMTANGIPADAEAVSEVLRLHRLYLASIPADDQDLDGLEADREGTEPDVGISGTVQADPDGHDRGPPSVTSAHDAREDAPTLR